MIWIGSVFWKCSEILRTSSKTQQKTNILSRLFPTQMLKESIATLKTNTRIFKDWNKMRKIISNVEIR